MRKNAAVYAITPFYFLLITFCFLAASMYASQYEVPKKSGAGAINYVWPEGKKGAVSLTFDDARPSQIDRGMPLFEKHHVRATFYVTPSNVPQRLEAWKLAAKKGHEIGNHTLNHPCTGNYPAFRDRAIEEMTLDQMAREIDGATKAVLETFGHPPITFAYPCGQTFVGRGKNTKSYVPLVAERFLAGRKWLSEDANDPSFCDLAQLLALESDGKTFEALRSLVDKARDEGRWLILCGHDIGEGSYQTTSASALEEFCRYCKDPANKIWIDTVAGIGQYIYDQRKKLRGH